MITQASKSLKEFCKAQVFPYHLRSQLSGFHHTYSIPDKTDASKNVVKVKKANTYSTITQTRWQANVKQTHIQNPFKQNGKMKEKPMQPQNNANNATGSACGKGHPSVLHRFLQNSTPSKPPCSWALPVRSQSKWEKRPYMNAVIAESEDGS